MDKFIDRIAECIKSRDYDLEKLCIVLPSQRAKKYLQRGIFNQYAHPVFSPQITTMDRWVRQCSARSVLDNTRSLFRLYEIHSKVSPTEDKGLDEFMKWGRTLLNDFDEIDRYLIKSTDLFRNLRDIKDIENWSFDSEHLTPAQERFMAFWDLLPSYYTAFNESLKKDEIAYMGSIYKEVAENIDLVFSENKEAHFIFAGFNALSPAEMSIMKQLHKMGRAELFIDADQFYLADHNHEAGAFLRKLISELQLSSPLFIQDRLASSEKKMELINCTQHTGQAKMAATILLNEIPPDELSETVLLLGDEKLIIPVLKNIPNTVGKANITIGLPLKNTAIRSWVDALFRAQESFLQFKSKSVYHKDFIRFIKHPFIQAYISKEDVRALQKIEATILSKNWLFIHLKSIDLREELKEFIHLCFQPWGNDYRDIVGRIRKINSQLFAAIQGEDYTLEKSLLFHFDEALMKLENILSEFQPRIHIKTFKTLFNQHWMNESIAYYGNPLDGLQVMGLLETRLLDFKNLIVVGLNDGSMPPVNPIQTMIPMDLRRFHGLPTPSEKEALFAHHFYRLLHHAKRCWFTYSSASSGFGIEEPSRYIRQLKLELSKQNPSIEWKESFYTVLDEEQDSQLVSIPKNESLVQRLDEYFLNKTSASALKKYLACPLDFYYRYIIGLGEEEQVEEDIEANTFGSFIHDTLEILYREFARFDKNEEVVIPNNPPLQPSDYDKMLVRFPKILSEQFAKHFQYDKQYIETGKNYLSHQIAGHLTEKLLKRERNELVQLAQTKSPSASKALLFIYSLESTFERELEVQVGTKIKTVRLKGLIDRIDRYNDEVRIIDYKSGKCTPEDVTITAVSAKSGRTPQEHLARLFADRKHVFQLLTYNYLYRGKYPHQPYPDKTGIISLININEGPFYLENKLTPDLPSLMELYEEALIHLIQEMYQTEVPFEHNPSSKFCSYCG